MKFVVFFISLILSTSALAIGEFPLSGKPKMQLYVGQVKSIKSKSVERVAVGNDDILSTSALDSGELIIIPKSVGQTEIFLWYEGNRREVIDVTVTALSLEKALRDVVILMSGIENVSVTKQGDRILVKGSVTSKDLEKSKEVLADYPHVVNMLKLNDFEELKLLLGEIPNVQLTKVRGRNKLTGTLKLEDVPKLEAIQKLYPDLIVLTDIEKVEMKKMIVIDVKILELRNNMLEDIGINWEAAINGPSMGFTGYVLGNDFFKIDPIGLTENIETGDTDFYGSVGMTTQITSTINLMEETGQARYLSNPLLSTRSGESANFHAGGEIPYAVRDQFGTTSIEFKPYGIMLDIEPITNERNEILTKVAAEVSTIDKTTAIGDGPPGLLTRSTETVVNAKSGDTIVIAGLVTAEDSTVYSKMPWLGDMPVLGPLFRSKSFVNRQSELVIFITPRIATTEAMADQYEFIDREMAKFENEGRPDSEMRLLD
ncbi:type II and III secretion system protein family protein [Motilimonas pumila]|uniref:Uncharacterized protein n=1 Tax=Motilimonas pumila TaxID=2303987 RepID=A0A418YAF8_9GAMM|nr:pilus assembly protein N-terminal domain-containing protein [Motilimonas pumila]RJG39515.1 hypothetical protein D1Z90_17920 [Motilimonas pumila]